MMRSSTYKKQRWLDLSGVRIEVNPEGVCIYPVRHAENRVLCAEVYVAGRLFKRDLFESHKGWKDSCIGTDPAECGVRVLDAKTDIVLASLDVELDPYPFMRRTGPQVHVTENYTAVPPALTITDEVGAVWTLGMNAAPEHKSPDGEFAFAVLRNGVNTGEIASRIERRGGKTQIFTVNGWKSWTGRAFF